MKKRSEIIIPEMKEGPGGGKKLRSYMKLQICARTQRAEKKGQIEQELSILVAKIRHLGTLCCAYGSYVRLRTEDGRRSKQVHSKIH